ncbi:hypothetical protein GQ457_02G023720 [Hibiscus cannabinus]
MLRTNTFSKISNNLCSLKNSRKGDDDSPDKGGSPMDHDNSTSSETLGASMLNPNYDSMLVSQHASYKDSLMGGANNAQSCNEDLIDDEDIEINEGEVIRNMCPCRWTVDNFQPLRDARSFLEFDSRASLPRYAREAPSLRSMNILVVSSRLTIELKVVIEDALHI